MKLAVLGRADPTGLGAMTDDFCRAMDPDLALVVDYSTRGKTDPGLVPGSIVLPQTELRFSDFWAEMLAGYDALVGFETFYDEAVLRGAKLAGCKTILFPMWECTQPWCDAADVMVCLSPADEARYPRGIPMRWAVDPRRFQPRTDICWPPKLIQHNAGTLGLNGRNGTEEFLQAARYLSGTGVAVLVRAQEQIPTEWRTPDAYYAGMVDQREDLWREMDLFVFPLKIPGLALPLIEAAAVGIPTLIVDIAERRDYHADFRVPIGRTYRCRIGGNEVEYRAADVEALGRRMRSMALGNVRVRVPPHPPTWHKFKTRWQNTVTPLIGRTP